MERWETLPLKIPPRCGRIDNVRQLFSFPAPNLSKLRSDGQLTGRWRLFTDLSSSEEPGIGDADIFNLDFLALNAQSIKRRDFRSCPANQHQATSIQLAGFKNLEHLTVHASSEYRYAFTSTAHIHLPHLKSLMLKPCKFHRIEWHLLVLQKLTFGGDRFDEPLGMLPDVQALHLCWPTGATNYKPDTAPVLRRSLKDVISKYGTAQKLIIEPFLAPSWEELYQSLKEEERVVGLQMVVFE